MVAIPRLDLPAPTSDSNITTSVAKAGVKITDYMLKQEQDATVLKHTKLDSDLRLGLTLKSQELKQNPEVQANPELYSEELSKFGQDFISKNTADLSYYSQARNKEALETTLNKAVLSKGSKYQIKQNAINQIQDLSGIVNNSSLEAFHEPSSGANSKLSLLKKVKQLQDTGVLRLEQGQKIIDKAFNSIDKSVIQGYLDTGDLENAEAYLNHEETQKNLGEAQYASFKGRIDQAKVTREKNIAKHKDIRYTVASVNYALDTNIPLDPNDTETKEALDVYYKNKTIKDQNGFSIPLSQSFAALDKNAQSELVRQTNHTSYIPKEAQSILNGFILNGNIGQQEFALDTIARMSENDRNNRALSFLDTKTRMVATSANRDISAGMPVKKALDLAQDKLNLSKDITEFRNSRLSKIHSDKKTDFVEEMKKTIAKATGLSSKIPFVGQSFDSGVNPITADKMLTDYKTLFDDYFLSTGDQELSTTLANKDFSHLYAISEVTNNKRLMKYAPEIYNSIPALSQSENVKWMKEQLQSDINEITGTGVDLDNVILIPDAQTAREVSGRAVPPSYTALLMNDDGDYLEVRKNGVIQRFHFDSSKARDEVETEFRAKQEEFRVKQRQGSSVLERSSRKEELLSQGKNTPKRSDDPLAWIPDYEFSNQFGEQ